MSNLTSIKTLCTNCLTPLVCEWPSQMNWGGDSVPAVEYMANALSSEDVQILCDDCLSELPDIGMDNMEIEYI